MGVTLSPDSPSIHPEPHLVHRIGWLRAAVLGANDGIVSVASILVGVASSGVGQHAVVISGLAGLVAGAMSMAAGEYVSVSSQRDSERAAIRREVALLEANPDGQIDQLAHMYEERGLNPETAHQVAVELTHADPLRAHLDVEYNLDPEDLNNPWAAAASSAVAFTLGSLIPLLAALLSPGAWMPWPIVVATVVALLLTGVVSARIGASSKRAAMFRVLIGGVIALAATWFIGSLFGTPVH